MENIIAKEIGPQGLDSNILQFLEEKQHLLNLSDAIVYYGFPVFRDYEENSVKSNFTILSPSHGIVLLKSSSDGLVEDDDAELSQLFTFIETALRRSKIMRISKRKLAIELESFLFLDDCHDDSALESPVIDSLDHLFNTIKNMETEERMDEKLIAEARAIIEGGKALARSIKRNSGSADPGNKLNVLIELEQEVHNFDLEQRKVAISLINGPQRIRGLAGSGKTVVLAMKAAHIHLQYPEKRILFTFYTKSLYGMIKESVSRFYRHFAGVDPDWDCIDILHAWGGKQVDGVCFNTCAEHQIKSLNLDEAKVINRSDPFAAVCEHINRIPLIPKYDYILIDEAQDLPNSFFQICYQLAFGDTGADKNIVWAYDELQSIFNVYRRSPAELFGVDEGDNTRIDLKRLAANLEFDQSNDLVLHRCYRNPLEVLVTAHALGFAIYGKKPVQMLENRAHWEDVGYRVIGDEELVVGKQVHIARDRNNSPLSINHYQDVADLIQCEEFDDLQLESLWIVDEIKKGISEGLNPDDILVISLDDRHAKSYFAKISRELSLVNIRTNNLLVSGAAAPPFRLENMVTLSTVHRAKGNEAALVFAAGIDAVFPERALRSGRNKLFTAMTRTRAWLRLSGVGKRARFFFNEIKLSLQNLPELVFCVPDKDEIETIQRDLEAKAPEIARFREMVGKLRKKGYSDAEIQMELGFDAGVTEDE